MKFHWFGKPTGLFFSALLLTLVFIVACGGASEPATDSQTDAKGTDSKVDAKATDSKVDAKAPEGKEADKEPAAEPVDASVPWASFAAKGISGGTNRVAQTAEPDRWDLNQSCCAPGPGAARDLYSNLLMFDPTDQETVIGDLAKSWEWADDGLSVTFQLWENAKWSDGEPVTADDVVFSLDRMTTEGVRRPRTKNLGPYYKSSEALDQNTVKVETLFASPSAFLPMLSIGYMAIVPKHVLDGREDAEDFFNQPENIIGSGAYRLVDITLGQGWKMERNPDYFKGDLPFLDEKTAVVIKDKDRFITAFMTDQVDSTSPLIIMPLVDALAFQKRYQDEGKGTVFAPNGTPLVAQFSMNWTKPPFNDPKVRRAVNLAIDRKLFIEVAQLGQAKMGQPFFPGSLWSFSDEEVATWPGYRYVDEKGELFLGDPVGVDGLVKHPDDIAEAKKLMADAGLADGFKASFHAYPAIENIPVVLKQQLNEAIGIETDIRIADTSSVIAREQSGEYTHFLMVRYGLNLIEPDDVFLGLYLKGGPRNALGYEDPKVRELFELEKSETDQAKRQGFVNEAAEIIRMGEGHNVILFWAATPRWVVPNRLQNYTAPSTLQYGYTTDHLWLDNK